MKNIYERKDEPADASAAETVKIIGFEHRIASKNTF
jgi:hypothetical protein